MPHAYGRNWDDCSRHADGKRGDCLSSDPQHYDFAGRVILIYHDAVLGSCDETGAQREPQHQHGQQHEPHYGQHQ